MVVLWMALFVLLTICVWRWTNRLAQGSPLVREIFRMYCVDGQPKWKGWGRRCFEFQMHGMPVRCRFWTITSGVMIQVQLPPLSVEDHHGHVAIQGKLKGEDRYEIPSMSAGSKRWWTNLSPEKRSRWASRVYWEFSRLLHLPGTNQVEIEWNGLGWRSQARFSQCIPSQLKEWIDASLSTYESLIVSWNQELRFVSSFRDSPGVSVVVGKDRGSDEKIDRLDATCGVCGMLVGSPSVVCRRCKSVHHRDCWEFNGRCSEFGCGETHYEAPISTLMMLDEPTKQKDTRAED